MQSLDNLPDGITSLEAQLEFLGWSGAGRLWSAEMAHQSQAFLTTLHLRLLFPVLPVSHWEHWNLGSWALCFWLSPSQNCVYQDKVALIPFQFFSFKTTIFYLLVLTACSELWDVRWTAIQQQENNLKPTTLQVCQSGLEHLSFGFNARLGFSLSFQKHTSTDLWGSVTGFNKPFLDPVICTFQYPGFVI